PVENASLMPWLAATALLHSASVLAARDALRAWTIMLGVIAFSMSMVGTFLVRSGILTSVHAFAVDPERGSFILALLAINIGGALALFGWRAGSIAEGERFALVSREGALVVNNVLLSAILGVVLLGTLYPLVTEAFDVRVSVGPPYFNPVSAIFALPMLAVMALGPLLRWRQDAVRRVRRPALLVAALAVAGAVIAWLIAGPAGLLPTLGVALAVGVGIASLLPLRGRRLTRTPLPIWGMVLAHLGIAVSLLGMASESAWSQERLAALAPGESAEVGPWRVTLTKVVPVAGPNWTAIEGDMDARYQSGSPIPIAPQARSFWSPSQTTTESALVTRWNGQLYAVMGEAVGDGRWQVRLWWKPLVTLIWIGGLLIALGGVLALIGRVLGDLKRRSVLAKRLRWRGEQSV
ncbi:MAG: heme lyase NrfEFG subunit NrfE, partial [Pelagerythrobacter marensis]